MITFDDCIGFERLYGRLLGNNTEIMISQHDKDGAANVLKELAEQKDNWTNEEKLLYKSLVEIVHRSK